MHIHPGSYGRALEAALPHGDAHASLAKRHIPPRPEHSLSPNSPQNKRTNTPHSTTHRVVTRKHDHNTTRVMCETAAQTRSSWYLK